MGWLKKVARKEGVTLFSGADRKSSRKVYNREFKLEAVALAKTSGKSPNQIERELGIAQGLLSKWKRQFQAVAPNTKWLADIMYIDTDEGFLYLAAVLDMCSRRIVGWAMADHLRVELVEPALASPTSP